MTLNKANLRDLIAATGLVILLKFDPNHRFFSPCDHEIWWMTPKNYRAPLLYYIKHCASFQIHRWIQTEVTVQKRSIRVKIGNFLSRVTLKFDRCLNSCSFIHQWLRLVSDSQNFHKFPCLWLIEKDCELNFTVMGYRWMIFLHVGLQYVLSCGSCTYYWCGANRQNMHGTVVGRDYLPEASPGSEPGSFARQRWHATATPLSQHYVWTVVLARKGSRFVVCSTSQLVSRIIMNMLVACMVSRQILKQSIGTVYCYARWEGKHGGMEIHTRKTMPLAAMIWQE